MLHALKLLLPAIIPSWNFFDVIVPSPRIQYSLLTTNDEVDVSWVEFRPRPKSLSIATMLKQLFFNAKWNESLFLVSCAERLIEYPTTHSEDEIFKRIIVELPDKHKVTDEQFIQFRLVFVRREGDSLVEEISYLSELRIINRSGVA